MKKTTLLMIASASMLLAAPASQNSKAAEGMYIMNKGQGSGMGMMNRGKCNMPNKCQGMKQNHRMKGKGMHQKKKTNSPFLIKQGLPHLSKMIMPYLNDPAFNLTSEQKEKLAKVRSQTMSAVMEAKPKVMTLRKEIVTASAAGVSAEALRDKVAKLALLEAAATMTHLKCIESTKAILTKDQLYFLLTNKNKMMKHGKKMMRGSGQQNMMMNMNRQGPMKCASGKCGQGRNR